MKKLIELSLFSAFLGLSLLCIFSLVTYSKQTSDSKEDTKEIAMTQKTSDSKKDTKEIKPFRI